MKYKLLFAFFILCSINAWAQAPAWSPYLVLTYKYTQPDGFLKTRIIIKKDSLIYQSFEPGKEMEKKMLLDTGKQAELGKLLEEHKFLSLNRKADTKSHGANSYTYVKDKFMKVINEPKNSKRLKKFDAFNKAFLEIVLPLVFKEETKGSWH